VSLKVLTTMMTAAGVFVATLHWIVRRASDREAAEERERANAAHSKGKIFGNRKEAKAVGKEDKSGKSKPKLSFLESLRVLAGDSYLRNIATMVLAYGLTIEFTELIWKATVKKALPEQNEYLSFLGKYSTYIGVASFVCTFIGANVTDRLGWQAGALMTPAVMGLLALPFFSYIIFGGTDSKKTLMVAMYIGLVQNVLSKGCKYAVFDTTKEMTYIPLEHDGKTKGKAAIGKLI
jgi:ATP:ADP antiporter, AAA family